MAIDYKQYNYPDFPYASETIAIAGCGPTACADILEIDPRETATWLQNNGWAYPYQGTIYEGIAACLSAYGAEGRMLASGLDGQTSNPAITEWERSIQSGYEGVLLMHNVVSSYWTSGGHYIAVVGYKDGLYLVYDPASDARTGWHPYSDFAGNVAAVYTSNKRWKTGDGYMFEFKEIRKGDSGKDVKAMQAVLRGRGYIDREKKKEDPKSKGYIEIDGSWGDSTQRAFEYFQQKTKLEILDVCDEIRWKKLLYR